MNVLKSLLTQLGRAEVSEVVLRSGQPPALRVDGQLSEADPASVSTDDLVTLLFSAGGSRYVETLGPKPTQWRTRVEGVGAVVVTATQEGEALEARFMLRDTPVAAKPAVKAGKSVRPPRGEGAPRSRPSGPRKSIDVHGAPTPRAPGPAVRFEAEQPPTPVRRAEMPTLPSEQEVDLDIGPSAIPSVPHPFTEEDLAWVAPLRPPPARKVTPVAVLEAPPPPSPRTLPGARFDGGARDDRDEPPPAQRHPTPMAVVATQMPAAEPLPPRGPTPAVRAPTPAPRRLSPAGGVAAGKPLSPFAELTEPFAPSGRRGAAELAGGSRSPSEPTPPPRQPRAPSGRTTRPFALDPHTPELRALMAAARGAGASDLHVIAARAPLLRVAGQIVEQGEPVGAQVVEEMWLSRIPPRLWPFFERDGSCDFALEDPDFGRFRVNVSRQRTGIKASLRLIPAEIPTLQSLGLPEAIAAATQHHQGLIVVTGPTGHGKTSTLAALVDILNRETTRHIITVEDPIEHLHPRKKALISQREVGSHTRSFSAALKASLREDPDVIVVGELRDAETVRMAITAGETGHLVIGTMNTPSAARTIDRLIDIFPPGDQGQVRTTLAGGLLLIVAQRLLPDAEGKRMVAACEILPGMVPLWNLIRDSRTYQIPSLQQRGKALGVVRLDDSLLELVRAGKTTAAAALAVAEAPDELEAALGLRRPSREMPRVTAPPRPPDPQPSEPQQPGKGGFFERAGAIFGGKKEK